MRSKISVIGENAEGLELGDGGRFDVVALGAPSADLAGSDVVIVLGGDVAAAAREVARRAAGAVLLVATENPEADCATALEAGLMPRPRVLGIARASARVVVEAVLYGRAAEVDAAVLCRGEQGVEDEVATVPVRVGAHGVDRIG